MPIFTLASASASPGVTTTVRGLALRWPRPVLVVEADPTGGSGLLVAFFGGRLEHPDGLIELALAQRQGLMGAKLPGMLLEVPDTQARLLAGSRSHGQAGSLTALWPDLLEALRDLAGTAQDVLLDAGRLGLEGWPRPLVLGADVSLLVTRSTLPALVAAHSWADTLRRETEGTLTRSGVVLVGEGHPYAAREAAKVLPLPVVASVAWDRKAAATLSRAHGRIPKRSPLPASLDALGETLRSLASREDARISPLTRLAQSLPVFTPGGTR